MVRFIKILEQICPIEEGAAIRLVPMKAGKDAQKINKDWLQLGRRAKGYHKVYTTSDSLINVN